MTIRVVLPVSAVKILPTGPVETGQVSNELKVVACPGEYEPGSFVIFAQSDITSLKVQADDLKAKHGVILAKEVDIKVVKCWYQSGSAWVGIEQDLSKRVLVPELLLKDDSLVKVDFEAKENYLKLSLPKREKYIWISNPEEKYDEGPIFPSDDIPIKDSSVLLPVDIPANTNKQFWVTVHVPDDAKPGNYTGRITLLLSKRKLRVLKLNLRVLPIELAEPYYTSSIFHRNPNGKSQIDLRYRMEMEDLLAHGVTDPIFYPSDEAETRRFLQIRKEVGMAGRPLYTVWGASVPLNVVKERIELFRSYGFTDVYFYGWDEAGGERLLQQRPTWETVRKAGGKMFASASSKAGHQGVYRGSYFDTVGDILDVFNCQPPLNREEAEMWHSVGHKVWSYANPHVGPESPEIFRRNYGLLIWKYNWDGAATYAYKHAFGNPWNDFDSVTRDITFVYPTIDGVINTIGWEGYREAVDDVRYVTTLMQAIEKAAKSTDGRRREVAEKAARYLETLDVDQRDLDAIRLEMIAHLLDLQGE